MERRRLGATTTSVPAIGQGTVGMDRRLDGSASVDFARLLRLGIDLGMNLIDTAETYGNGCSEEIVGQAVRGVRSRTIIATKFAPQNSTFDGIIRSAESSLRRLQTDYIDIYQNHWPNPSVPIEETMRAMEKLVRDGKVRYIGVSNLSLNETLRARSYLENDCLVSTQHEYNVIDRTIEQHLIPFCRKQRLTLIAYSPLAHRAISPHDQRSARLTEIAERYGLSVAQLVLNWLLRDPSIVVIPKTSKENHLRENVAAIDRAVDAADHDKISRLFPFEIQHIATDLIEISDSTKRGVYTTLEEALKNHLRLVPGPTELSRQIGAGEFLKPIKVRCLGEGGTRYQLLDGGVRYWAWVIAHEGKVPIPALVECNVV